VLKVTDGSSVAHIMLGRGVTLANLVLTSDSYDTAIVHV
jgi:hypothetical protein